MDHAVDPVVDLVIPARNEQENIPALLAVLPRSRLRHVVLVDNGSTDQTAQLARRGGIQVVSEPRRGYGVACLAGLDWIEQQPQPPDIVTFLDADLADDPTQLVRLCGPIASGRADMVIASRRRLAQAGALTITQRFGNALACGLIRLCTGQRFTDLGPMRAVNWRSLCALDMKDQTWGWTVEMQYKAAAYKLRVIEIHTVYRRRHAGRSKISGTLIGSTQAGWKIIVTIARLWWHTRRCQHGLPLLTQHRPDESDEV